MLKGLIHKAVRDQRSQLFGHRFQNNQLLCSEGRNCQRYDVKAGISDIFDEKKKSLLAVYLILYLIISFKMTPGQKGEREIIIGKASEARWQPKIKINQLKCKKKTTII